MADATPTDVIQPPLPAYYDRLEFTPSNDDRQQLAIHAVAGAPKLPDDMLAFRRDCFATGRTITLMFKHERDIRNELFTRLHEAAWRGLMGVAYDLADGKDNLQEVQTEIADKAVQIRDQRLRQYTMMAVLFGIIPLMIGGAVLQTNGYGLLPTRAAGQSYDQLTVWVVSAFWIPAGAAICLAGEFALRMQSDLKFDTLLTMDPGRWMPGQRLVITIGVAFIFAFCLAFKIVQIGLGSILLNEFIDKTPGLALAIGGITALAFTAVRDIIFRITPAEKR